MYDQLLEAGRGEEQATRATCRDAVDELCDLVEQLMDLIGERLKNEDEARFFVLQIDVNQQGCIKFHDGRRFTTMRIQVPLYGVGPVLAAPEDVDWAFWEAEGGLLGLQDEEEDTELSVVEEWNQKISKSEVATSSGRFKR